MNHGSVDFRIARQCNNRVSIEPRTDCRCEKVGGKNLLPCERRERARKGTEAEEDPEPGVLFDRVDLVWDRPSSYLVGNQVWLAGGIGSYGLGSWTVGNGASGFLGGVGATVRVRLALAVVRRTALRRVVGFLRLTVRRFVPLAALALRLTGLARLFLATLATSLEFGPHPSVRGTSAESCRGPSADASFLQDLPGLRPQIAAAGFTRGPRLVGIRAI